MKTILLFSVISLLCGVSRAEKITLRSGADIEEKVLSVDSASVNLGNGKSLPRTDVTEIQFQARSAAPQTAQAVPASPEDQAAARNYFAQAAALAKKYPGANGLTLLDSGTHTLNPDGTNLLHVREVKQILKDSLKRHWGQIVVCPEEGRGRVKILKANVYNPDGSIHTLDPSRIKTSKPQTAGGSFFISGSICTQYVLPNVQKGSIVDYELSLENYNPFRKDFFFPQWGFQGDQGPVAISRFSVTVPSDVYFQYSPKNFSGFGSAKPSVSVSGKNTTYSWELKNVQPMAGEPMMPSYTDVAPYLRGSILKDWEPIFSWTEKMYRERTQPSPELKQFTLDLVKDARTDEEKAAKIYHYVQKEIRYIAVKVGIASGTGGYDANLTWNRRYGCCVDKALLLTTMLNVAGIKASPIIINTNNKGTVDFSIPHIEYDHAITVADINGEHIFLDSTNFDFRYPQIASFDYGVQVLNIFDRKIDFVPIPAPRDNGSFYDYTFALSPSGEAVIEEKMHYSGSREGDIRGYYRSLKKEERKLLFQSFAKSAAPTAELISHYVDNTDAIEKPFGMGMKYKVPDYPQRAGDILIVKLPDFEINPRLFKEVSLAERRYPIEYAASMGRYLTYTLTLPGNYEVVSLPEKFSLKNKHASFSAGCEKRSASKVSCSLSWERPGRVIPPEDYAAYKALLQKAAAYSKTQIFLRNLSASRAAASKGESK